MSVSPTCWDRFTALNQMLSSGACTERDRLCYFWRSECIPLPDTRWLKLSVFQDFLWNQGFFLHTKTMFVHLGCALWCVRDKINPLVQLFVAYFITKIGVLFFVFVVFLLYHVCYLGLFVIDINVMRPVSRKHSELLTPHRAVSTCPCKHTQIGKCFILHW